MVEGKLINDIKLTARKVHLLSYLHCTSSFEARIVSLSANQVAVNKMTPGPILDHSSSQNGNHVNGKSAYPQPLQPSGTLDQFKFEDTTPTIGREFLGVNIVDDLLNAGEDANARLRDLAITSEPSSTNPRDI